MNSLSGWLRRPGLVCLVVLYAVAVSLVHDAASLLLGALVVGLTLLRGLLIVKLARRGPA
jgi:hypothetical protein